MKEVEESGALDKPGNVLITGSLKGEKRAKEKVDTDYKGDWTRLTDVVRSSIGVDGYHSVKHILDKVKAAGLKIAKKPKDRFSKPTPVGYRDVLLNVQFPNGHIGELQLHVKPMLKAKAKAHEHYDVLRNFEDANQQKRRDLKPEEEAWDAANTKKTASSRVRLTANRRIRLTARGGNIMAAETGVRYYVLDDMPCYRKPHQLPIQLIGDNKERVIYDMYYFDHNADMIEASDYVDRKKKAGY